ncbi:MAG: hypothetical protein RIB45_02890 [Marivibrio sp.]|uniref:hypothetical protein n=1 Tax=Marivibrio sp. TaxID=2039719 RepID=UPI0032ED47E4
MFEEHLTNPRGWFGALLVLGFFFLMWKFARKPGAKPQTWEYSYDYVCERAEEANDKLAETFQAMLAALKPKERKRAHLIRLAVMNRGAWRIAPENHLRPLTVAFPQDARLLAAEFVEAFGPAPEGTPQITRYERGIEVAPFDLPVNCALVFQLVATAPPSVIDGGIEGQAAIERLK